MKYDLRAAYEYYREHMLGPFEAKSAIYDERNIPKEGLLPFRDWEVMASLLVDDRGSASGSGSDLTRHEVKSAKRPGSFEYQYHRNHGTEKLDHDLTIEHLYFAYESGYRDVVLYSLTAGQFAEVGEVWREQLVEAYGNPRNQRFRRSVSYGRVVGDGCIVMKIEDGDLVTQ